MIASWMYPIEKHLIFLNGDPSVEVILSLTKELQHDIYLIQLAPLHKFLQPEFLQRVFERSPGSLMSAG